jgi:hypothetical protein
MRGAAVSSGISANSVAEYEAAGRGHGELTIGLMDGAWQSHPSILVAGTLLFGAGSLVLVLGALVMLVDSVASFTAIRAEHKPGWLVRLYCERVSPLVHIPRRRRALRSALVVLLVIAPAFPRLEINGWAPETPRVLWNVLRIVKFSGDELGPVRGLEEGRLMAPQAGVSTARLKGWTDLFQHVNRTCNGRLLVGLG